MKWSYPKMPIRSLQKGIMPFWGHSFLNQNQRPTAGGNISESGGDFYVLNLNRPS